MRTAARRSVLLPDLISIRVGPITDEIIGVVWLVMLQAVVAGVLLVGLRLLGGRGTYRQTLIAQSLLAVLLMPISNLAERVGMLLEASGQADLGARLAQLGTGLNAAYAIPMLCAIHRVKRRRVLRALAGLTTATVLVTVGVLSCVGGLRPGSGRYSPRPRRRRPRSRSRPATRL